MKIFGLPEALLSLCPNAHFEFCGDDYSGIKWYSDDIKLPSEQELIKEKNRLQSEYDLQQYAENRKNSYPSIGDQLDALFHAGVFPEEMAKQIQAVKDQYPKPEQLDG